MENGKLRSKEKYTSNRARKGVNLKENQKKVSTYSNGKLTMENGKLRRDDVN